MTRGTRAALLIALSAMVLALSTVAGGAQTVNVLMLTEPLPSQDRRAARALERAGREIRADVSVRALEIGSRPNIEALLRIMSTIVEEPIDVIVGLTFRQIILLEAQGMTASVPFRLVGGQLSPALFYTGSQPRSSRSWDGEGVVGLPFEVMLPMVCFRRDGRLAGYFSYEQPSILEIAYGKVAERISMPDPRADTVGRSVLMSVHLAAGSVNAGWEAFRELDRNVKSYRENDLESCRDVYEKQAAIGFTAMAAEESVERMMDGVETKVIRDGALIPIRFSVAVKRTEHQPPEVVKLLQWLSREWLRPQFDRLEKRARESGSSYDVSAMAYGHGKLRYVAPEQLVDEWAAQYAYKSALSGKGN